MEWKADWAWTPGGNDEPTGADSDGLMISSHNDHTAGAWADAPIESSYRAKFICEKNK